MMINVMDPRMRFHFLLSAIPVPSGFGKSRHFTDAVLTCCPMIIENPAASIILSLHCTKKYSSTTVNCSLEGMGNVHQSLSKSLHQCNFFRCTRFLTVGVVNNNSTTLNDIFLEGRTNGALTDICCFIVSTHPTLLLPKGIDNDFRQRSCHC